jgi:hypothetical protein
MSNLQQYTDLQTTVDGALLSEQNQVQIRWISGNHIVDTTPKGFAGLSPGSARIEIHVTNAWPAAGLEYNPIQRIRTMQEVELSVQDRSGRSLTTRGYFTEADGGHSTNQASSFSFSFVGTWADWE